MANKTVLELNNLVKNYPGFRLGPLNLSVPSGSIVGYIGENGAGKSTTIKLILGLAHADEGTIKIFGQTLGSDTRAVHDQLGVVLDELNLPYELTVEQAEKMCRGIFRHWQRETFSAYLQQFSLPLKKKTKELSRGMKMKLSLAIALSHQPRFLILDEATSGLDPVVREEVLDILLDFIQNEDCSVFISSHILSDLEKAADYIAFLHQGQLIFMEQKDILREKHGLLVCDAETARTIPERAIVGRRSHQFGENLLVLREDMPQHLLPQLDRPTIEDIMIFFIKDENGKHAPAWR